MLQNTFLCLHKFVSPSYRVLLLFTTVTFLCFSYTIFISDLTVKPTLSFPIKMSSSASATGSADLVVITTTWFRTTSESRFLLTEAMCREAGILHIPVVITDGSPNLDVGKKLVEAGAGYITMIRQDSSKYKGKGGAIRQAIEASLKIVSSDGAIAFQEPEKLGMIKFQQQIAGVVRAGEDRVVVPFRNNVLFKETYPREQYHSETFANQYINILSREAGFKVEVDWTFGPFAFSRSLADLWLEYDGELWDAQMVPFIRGHLKDVLQVSSLEIPYRHPPEMKEEEEGKLEWCEKRLKQLNVLFPRLKEELQQSR